MNNTLTKNSPSVARATLRLTLALMLACLPVAWAQTSAQLFGAAAAGQAMGQLTEAGPGPATQAGTSLGQVGGDAGAATAVLRSREAAPPAATGAFRTAAGAVRIEPNRPNEFQKFVLEATGFRLPLFGQDFFDNVQFTQRALGLAANNSNAAGALGAQGAAAAPLGQGDVGGAGFAPIDNAPVSAEYVLGPGDQVQVRAWGSVEMDVRGYIDRSGLLTLPRVGTVPLAGVKAAQAEGAIRAAISRYFKGFELSVTLAGLRPITVYVVGQARRPGSYAISGTSTLASGLFATGGPSASGSVRHVQLKRGGQLLREFDLYDFLSKGDGTGDVKLVDGDVIVIPPAKGYVALVGMVNNPAVYELARDGETLDQLLSVAGGLPVTANQSRVSLERLDPSKEQPRSVESFALSGEAKSIALRAGDILTVQAILPEIANAVTLRGHVAQPSRLPYKEGMRVRDLIPNRQSLINRESVRMQNESLFDRYQRERVHVERDRVPQDLISERLAQGQGQGQGVYGVYGGQDVEPLTNQRSGPVSESYTDERAKISPESVGRMFDEINWDYAVIERLNRKDLTSSLVPFNLARVLADEKDPDNVLLQPGDVVTIFSVEDVRVPIAKRRLMVRIEGEVNSPGYYQLKPGQSLLDLLQKAGGLTPDAYLFGSALYREDVRKAQTENLQKLIRRLEAEGNTKLMALSQSTGASLDALMTQNRILAAQQVQRQTLERLRTVKPEGRIALSLAPSVNNYIDQIPQLKLQNGDRFVVPSRPDFVYVFGSVNTESALLYRAGMTVEDYLNQSGLGTGADTDAVIVVRADGSVYTTNGSWFGSVSRKRLMPGDSIIVPDKVDLESGWSTVVRNTKDVTQIIYQLGIGAAAFKALGY